MPHPYLTRPNICSIRAAARQAELAEGVRAMTDIDGWLPADGNLPLPGRGRRVHYRGPAQC